MIEGNGTALAESDPFEDAIEATAFIATAHLQHGELMLPERIREHLADGLVVVHLLRGEDDVAVHEATLTSRSTLAGIEWPEDVKPRTSLVVMCPRGAQSHDVAVRLPDLPEPLPFVEAVSRDFDEVDPIALVAKSEDVRPSLPRRVPGAALAALGVDEDPDRAVVAGVLPDDPWEQAPTWPGHEELAAGETTEVLTAVVVPVPPDLDEDDHPGSVFSAALVAVRSKALIARQQPPRRAGWLERRIREAARLVLEESRAGTRVTAAIASGLVLFGGGLGYLVQWAVTR